MRAVTAWDGLDAAAHRARELEAELRVARWQLRPSDQLCAMRLAYLGALGESVFWSQRIIAAATAADEDCPFCRRKVTP